MENKLPETADSEIFHKVTLQDIAIHFNISLATASRALSGKGRISYEMRQRVQDYAKEIGYVSPGHRQEKEEKSGGCGSIGVVIPRDLLYDSAFFSQCLLGIADMAASNDVDVVIVLSDSGSFTDVRRVVRKKKVDGMILTRTVAEDACAEYLEKEGIPTVCIGSCKYDLVQLDSDTAQACREMTEYLYVQSGKNIAFIGGEMGYTVNQSRFEGYQHVMEEHGSAVDPSMVYCNIRDMIGVRGAVEQLLSMRVNSILCADDVLCGMVLSVLEENRVWVPDDVSIASCYDSRLIYERTPSVTAVSVNPTEEGKLACHLLLSMLRGEKVEKISRMEYSIHLRQSTRRMRR